MYYLFIIFILGVGIIRYLIILILRAIFQLITINQELRFITIRYFISKACYILPSMDAKPWK